MPDLVRNPEDRFSHDMAHKSLVARIGFSDQVQHKPGCAAAEASLFGISDLETRDIANNNGADVRVDLHLGYSLRPHVGLHMKNLLCVKNIFQKIKPLWYSKIKVHCLRLAQLVACL